MDAQPITIDPQQLRALLLITQILMVSVVIVTAIVIVTMLFYLPPRTGHDE